MGAVYFVAVVCGSELKRSRWNTKFYSTSSMVKNLKFKVYD
jgi:hypothetical protein